MLEWQEIDHDMKFNKVYRAKIPGGWLVLFKNDYGNGLTFYPDPEHKWDGKSIK